MGLQFRLANRGFFAPAGTPTLVNTAFIGLAFLDLLSGTADDRPAIMDRQAIMRTAQSACQFILRDLHRLSAAPDEICLSYTPIDQRYVHNANTLGAWLLAETAGETNEPGLAAAALAAARYTTRRQRSDGAWRYGEGAGDGWVDNFHTGFVLVSLRRIGLALHTPEFDPAIQRGYTFWKTHFFDPEGAPRYYDDRTYPLDVHSAAQAILTFLSFSAVDPQAREWAKRVAVWAVENMQSARGYFHFQIHRHYRIEIPYMRWSQAWMLRTLTELAGSQQP